MASWFSRRDAKIGSSGQGFVFDVDEHLVVFVWVSRFVIFGSQAPLPQAPRSIWQPSPPEKRVEKAAKATSPQKPKKKAHIVKTRLPPWIRPFLQTKWYTFGVQYFPTNMALLKAPFLDNSLCVALSENRLEKALKAGKNCCTTHRCPKHRKASGNQALLKLV